MLSVKYTAKFRKDARLAKKRGFPIQELQKVVSMLREEIPLEPKYYDHALEGDWRGFRECHIQPDWLLIYRIDHGEMILVAQRTGTHSDLFGK